MLAFRLVAITFSMLMIYVVRVHYIRKHIPLLESFFWYCVWISLIIIIIKPELLQSLAATFAVYRVFDLLTIIAFMLLFSFLILDRIKIYHLEKKMHDLVRSTAIDSQKIHIKKK